MKLSGTLFLGKKLPDDLEMKILSYLYFSKDVGDKIKVVNNNIKCYNNFQLTHLHSNYELSVISYFVLKYYVYDKPNSEKLLLDYNMISKTQIFQQEEIKRIFSNIRLVDTLRLRKYIEQDGSSSEYFLD